MWARIYDDFSLFDEVPCPDCMRNEKLKEEVPTPLGMLWQSFATHHISSFVQDRNIDHAS